MKNYEERLNDSLKRINTVHIDDIDKVFKLMREREYQDDIKRFRAPFFYRGLPNCDYSLQTTLQRNCKHKRQTLEETILRNFSKYAIDSDPLINESIWRKMILGQHHGLPTRLMDWSYSPLVGLHFAVSENNAQEFPAHDCSIWEISCLDIINILPDSYVHILNKENAYLFTVGMLSSTVDTLQHYICRFAAMQNVIHLPCLPLYKKLKK